MVSRIDGLPLYPGSPNTWSRDVPASLPTVEPPPPADGASWVYFAQSGTHGPVKIGFGRNVAARLRSHQVGHPHPLRLVGVLPGGRNAERLWHNKFAAHCMTGEWFRPAPDLISRIREAISHNAAVSPPRRSAP
jgi:hypothetical protein